MRNKFILLLKMQMYNFFGINKLIHSNNKKQKNRSAILAICGGAIVIFLFAYASIFYLGLANLGMTDMLPSIIVFLCSVITLIMTLLRSPGLLFGMRDYDLIMSLPVKSSEVVISRLAVVYLMNLAISMIITVPAAVVYGIYIRPEFFIYAIFLLAIFIIPIIPMIVSLFVGVAITAVSARGRHKNIISLIFYTVLVLIVLFATAQLQYVDTSKAADIGTLLNNSMTHYYPPAGWVSSAILSNNWINLLMFLAISILSGGIFVVIAAHFFSALNTASNSIHTHKKFKLNAGKEYSQFKTLYRREFGHYFSCTIYVLNSSIGVILLLVSAIVLQFISPSILETRTGIPGLVTILKQNLPFLVATFVSMTCTTSAALSLEGKSRWIICSLPLEPIKIFNAKIAVNLTVLLPIVYVSSIMLAIATHANVLEAVLLFVVPTVYSLFISVMGMYMNFKFPKYDWTSEYYAVKGGSISVMGAALIGLLSSIIPLLLCMALPAAGNVIMCVSILFLMLITVYFYRKLQSSRLYV